MLRSLAPLSMAGSRKLLGRAVAVVGERVVVAVLVVASGAADPGSVFSESRRVGAAAGCLEGLSMGVLAGAEEAEPALPLVLMRWRYAAASSLSMRRGLHSEDNVAIFHTS